MTREEFDILMSEYGVPIEAAERFAVEEKDATDWKAEYQKLKADFDAAKDSYLDKVFSRPTEEKQEEKKVEYTIEEEREV